MVDGDIPPEGVEPGFKRTCAFVLRLFRPEQDERILRQFLGDVYVSDKAVQI